MDTPEAFFIRGGGDQQQFYSQPGLDPEHDAQYNTPYDRGAAAVDWLIHSGKDPADIRARKEIEARIEKNVANVKGIEADRKLVADGLSEIARRRLGR